MPYTIYLHCPGDQAECVTIYITYILLGLSSISRLVGLGYRPVVLTAFNIVHAPTGGNIPSEHELPSTLLPLMISGYARIVLALISFYYMPTHYMLATWCYIISGFLDAVDGHAARMLNQGSRFGAMLDMLTDRCATMCLLVVLCQFYPRYMFLFQLSMIIDIVSHWIHVQSSMMKGIESHKKIDLSGNPILKHYYHNRKILFAMCAGNELFYAMLYLCHFTSGPVFPLGPLSFGLWTFVGVICAPVALVKTGISVVQLYAACQNVTTLDLEERRVAREAQGKTQ